MPVRVDSGVLKVDFAIGILKPGEPYRESIGKVSDVTKDELEGPVRCPVCGRIVEYLIRDYVDMCRNCLAGPEPQYEPRERFANPGSGL